MENEYISIRQFAETSGKSVQAIYQQLETRLKSYVKVIDNKKMIDKRALVEVFETPEQITIDKPIENELISELKSELTSIKATLQGKIELIDNMQQQINELKADKENLNNQIQELTTALKASQSIQAMYVQQIETKQEEPEQQEEQEKKSFWSKLLKR